MFLLIYKKIYIYIFVELIANLAGKINNIEAYCVNRDCVEGPAITVVGAGEGRRGTLSHSHVDYATKRRLTERRNTKRRKT
jgi:hypothetical protein